MHVLVFKRLIRLHKRFFLILKVLTVWILMWLVTSSIHQITERPDLLTQDAASDLNARGISVPQSIKEGKNVLDHDWVSEMTSALGVIRKYSFFHQSNEYKVANYVAPALAYKGYIPKHDQSRNVYYTDLTISSQCSMDNLYYLPALAERFKGPISLAVFYIGTDLGEAVRTIISLRYCYNEVRRFVSFHLVYMSSLDAGLKDYRWTLLPCSTFNDPELNYNRSLTIVRNYSFKVPYPNNLLRNIARTSVFTEFVLVTDVDMIPSELLRQKFMEFAITKGALKNTCIRVAYVLPVFEVEKGRYMPENKEELLGMLDADEARIFYEALCYECHASRYIDWSETPYMSKYQILSEELWAGPWEPFTIVRNDAPLYDERFRQYGDNRVSQTCEMHMAGYTFVLLSDAFLIHQGLKKEGDFHATKDDEMARNDIFYEQFKNELIHRYPSTWRRCN